ncbi:Mor transcription activator family protein [Psychrobacter sp. I-STPA10]|uniref:Mor transcription activator family protein n=1 Tax=Psychrobacter sp. I-STPA10 TaxID=2585769 RepID=UPI001E5C8266|nr:Mor transcription activator family protein [Psychrobacter sp. I-STPA10]
MSEQFELTSMPSIEQVADVGNIGSFFASFIELLQAELVKFGIKATDASRIVSQVVCQLSQAFAGESFYITSKPAVFARHMAMYADLQTMPSYDVDRKYGVSRGYSLTVAKQIDSKRKRRDQLKLDF